jgi:hypothetical protein
MSLLDGDEKSHRCLRGDSQEWGVAIFGWIAEAAMKMWRACDRTFNER